MNVRKAFKSVIFKLTAMSTLVDEKPECCPEFIPEPWDNQTITWEHKLFVKDHIITFFYMPLNFGQVMRRLDKKIKAAEAKIPDYLCLSDHTSKWNMDIYLAVDKEIPDVEKIFISGKFFSKVYEGSFQDTGKWCKDFDGLASSRGLTIKKLYMWYTTCPKCAKKYGKNYVVILGQID